jgi:Family of unknown function (DUF6220)
MRVARYAFAAVAILFVVGVAYQVFLAGMAVFGAGAWEDHIGFGYLIAMVPLLSIIVALVARAGRRTTWLAVATLVAAQVQTMLPLARDDVPWLAALHPVNAMLVFGLGVVVGRRAVSLARLEERARHVSAGAIAQEV